MTAASATNSCASALGEFDRANLNRVIRADGVIVKPDDAITPLDATYIEQANDRRLPIVAAAHTRHQRSITSYVFAFGQPAEQRTARLSPSALGHKGPVYAYNYFDGYGMHLQPGQAVNLPFPTTAPTGSSSRSGPQAWDSWATAGNSYRMAGIALHVFWIPVLSRHESFFPQANAGCVFTDLHSRNRKSARREQPSQSWPMIPKRAFFTSTWLQDRARRRL